MQVVSRHRGEVGWGMVCTTWLCRRHCMWVCARIYIAIIMLISRLNSSLTHSKAPSLKMANSIDSN